ncbi:uncharacterized protein LOC100201250 [Hydra vulgaris]|uniref:Uncharacterized protein LOC100201250 n=1 Tax=Hydra vulgaris TaxID=6087 RepID=A0ABM4BXU7_HYDVU
MKVLNFLKHNVAKILAAVLCTVSLVVLIVGVLNYNVMCPKKSDNQNLIDFISKIKKIYYQSYPQETVYDPDVTFASVLNNFTPYNPNPIQLKSLTDLAKSLKDELKNLKLDVTKMAHRERKAYAQVTHFLESIFGNPFDGNYYAGVWMMGPNYFCWQPICSIGSNLKEHFSFEFSPKTIAHVEKIIESIKNHKTILTQYNENLNYGIHAGMVRAVDDCNAGNNAFRQKFPKTVEKGATGIREESFTQNLLNEKFYSNLSGEDHLKFQEQYKENILSKVSNTLVEYLGKPLHALITYLDKNYTRYCVPSSVSSGLGNLPLNYVWKDGIQTNITTTQSLPTGEKLDGKKSYKMILPYFTTTNRYSPEDINELGLNQTNILFKRAIILAKQITKKNAEDDAIKTFIEDLNDPKHFFNTSLIPESENGNEGAKKCKNMATAKINCPVRYNAMNEWFKYVRELLAIIDPMTVSMFNMVGKQSTTPNCPLKMVANFNPSSGSQSYQSSGSDCKMPCQYNLPFFLERPGPKYSAFSVAGHEGRPGHHTQVQGFYEHFLTSGDEKDVIDWLDASTYFTAFTEGWALYAENPLLAQETTYYQSNPLQEYGMVKWQIWRALRLIIDTGLHYRNLTQDQSLDLFRKYAWDFTDKSLKDTIRYMSGPGQATAYMIGQLVIWNIRNTTENKFKKNNVTFNEKEFHYHLLSQGSSPLDYLIDYMDGYTDCKINTKSRSGCSEILNPNKKIQKKVLIGTKKGWYRLYKKMRHEHYD